MHLQQLATTKMDPPHRRRPRSPPPISASSSSVILFFYNRCICLFSFCFALGAFLSLPPPVLHLSLSCSLPYALLLLSFLFSSTRRLVGQTLIIISKVL